jgi:YggT family protein
MTLLLVLAALVLLLFQLALLARAGLDWSAVLAGPAAPGTRRARLSVTARRITEPVLAPVRRVVPPLRLGSVALDTSFVVVFLAVLVLRQVLPFG